jgi:mannose-1-phosphate guanylyltransferase/mannose-6-phosphate isomerase
MTLKARTRALILSGGSGTRLWPLSREAQPKQFHDLTQSGAPLLANTIKRLQPFFDDVRILTTSSLSSATLGLLKEQNLKASLLCEPFGKNTAAAAYLACFQAAIENFDGVIGLFSADHVILKTESFRNAVTQALNEAALGHIVTLGIHPTYPSTAYGYIQLQSTEKKSELLSRAAPTPVKSFIEKPSPEKAKELIQKDSIFWNAGIFFFKAQSLMKLFEEHYPDLPRAFSKLKLDFSNLEEVYKNCPSQSLDKAVMEKITSDLRCIPCDIGWTDVGSWEEAVPFYERVLSKSIVEVLSEKNSYLNFSGQPRSASFVGCDELIVVDTQDALLVLKKGKGQELKTLVDRIKSERPRLTKEHSFETRPWGKFEILRDEGHYKSKKITVLPSQKLSYQSHKKRSENWVIVRGNAEVTLNEKVIQLKIGESIFIPCGAKHRIANPSSTDLLEFIEVQTGEYFGEDDITRYSDEYGRS